MNIDGVNTLACTKAIDDCGGDVKIYPLPHMPVVKDLVPDLTNFYAQYASMKPWLQTRTPAPPDRERLQSKEDQEKIDRRPRASCARAARRRARATGGTAIASSGPAALLRRIAGSSTRATKPPASGSTSSKIRSGCTAATRS